MYRRSPLRLFSKNTRKPAWGLVLKGACIVFKNRAGRHPANLRGKKMQVWQSVKAKPTHPRGGDATGQGAQAGVVMASDPAKTDVVVKWDLDGVSEAVAIDELQAL